MSVSSCPQLLSLSLAQPVPGSALGRESGDLSGNRNLQQATGGES